MSIKVDRCQVMTDYEEMSVKWADDFVHLEIDEIESISSEEGSGSEYDSEQRARTKPALEIWDDKQIWTKLQNLPDAEDVINSIENEDQSAKNKTTTLLIATWLQKTHVIKKMIEMGTDPNVTDGDGRTPLHLAACTGNGDCLKLLLDAGSDVTSKDAINKATPLHCAASKGNLTCLKALIRHGADVNAGLTFHKSPLHYAVQSMATECVKELLENGAIPNTPQVFSEAPLHVAAASGCREIVALLLGHGAAVNVQCGADKLTPLHLAAEDGDAECARLLIEAGADLSAENNKRQTPVHLAALSQCSETLELLLGKRANPNARDKDGRTPLHCAIAKVSRSCECVRLLLGAGADVNRQDSFGYTPLHLAALNEFSNCVMMLLSSGGDVTIRTNGGISVLTFITRKTPDVIPKYIDKFTNSIKLNDHEIGDVDCELKLDFRVLVPTMGQEETELLLNFIEVGHKEVLKHPLCETFLFLKWRRIRKFFLFSLFYHTLFVILYSIYIMGVFVWSDFALHYKLCGYFLICLNIMLLSKEMFQIWHSWRVYVKQWENWLQWLIIVSVFSCVQPELSSPDDVTSFDVDHWQHHVAAIGIFLAWVELMMIVGRFPVFGLYIQMFTRVSINFVKFVAAYFCLLIAFALSFGILFAKYPAFEDLKWVIIKILVMMSGELEYEDIFYAPDAPIIYHWTSQIMFLGYVLLVTVILTNLTVGLAVSDIQGLQQSAGLDRLVRQVELVAHLESMLFSRLLSFVPHKLMHFLHKQALLLKSQYHWALYVKPNDPREERIPKDLIAGIFKLMAEKRETKPCNRNRVKRKSGNKFQHKSPPLSRLNSNASASELQLEELYRELQAFTKVFGSKLQAVQERIALGDSKKPH